MDLHRAPRLCDVATSRRTRPFPAQYGTASGSGRAGGCAGSTYIYMVALHATWLVGLWLLAPARPIEAFWFAVFALAQIARLWVLATLKTRWTTRIHRPARRSARRYRPLPLSASPELRHRRGRDRGPAARLRPACLCDRLLRPERDCPDHSREGRGEHGPGHLQCFLKRFRMIRSVLLDASLAGMSSSDRGNPKQRKSSKSE